MQPLEQLYREMAPALLAYFRRQRGLAGTAEDMLQDTFVRALRSVERLRAAVSPRAYLFGIAHHLSLDALRRAAPPGERVPELMAAPPADVDERLERLRAAIDELPPRQREALLLKLHHDLTYQEVAEVLHVPIGTVRSRLHHAVRHLKELLNPPEAARPASDLDP